MKLVIVSYEGPGEEWVGGVRLRSLCNYFLNRGDTIFLLTSDVNIEYKLSPLVRHIIVKTPPLLKLTYFVKSNLSPQKNSLFSYSNELGSYRRKFLRASYNLCRVLEQNIFLPDSKILWYRNARRQLTRLVERYMPDVLISIGNPVSHMVALAGKKQAANIAWVAELQDPWPHRVSKKINFITKTIDRKIEDYTMRNPDHLITVTKGISNMYRHSFVSVVPFGSDICPVEGANDINQYTIAYYGNIYGGRITSFRILLLGFRLLLSKWSEKSLPRIQVFSSSAPREVGHIVMELNLQNAITFSEPLKRDNLFRSMASSHVLISLQGNELRYAISSKVYDYIMTQRPILGVMPSDCEEAKFLRQINGAYVAYSPKSVAHYLNSLLVETQTCYRRRDAYQFHESNLVNAFGDVVTKTLERIRIKN